MRGIAKNEDNHFYVVDSGNNRVLKFDDHWKPLRITNTELKEDGHVFINHPFGLYVTSDFVFVCAKRKSEICIFFHNLDHYCDIPHLINVTDVTMHDGRFFATTKGGIVVLEINFKSRSYKATKISSIVTKNGMEQPFDDNKELRSICASDKYLYVTENYEKLFCLQYEPDRFKLNLIASLENCHPIVVFHHSGTIYLSQEDKSTPEKLFQDPSSGEMKILACF